MAASSGKNIEIQIDINQLKDYSPKYIVMDKEEIKNALQNSPYWNRPDKDSHWWKVAFDEYHKASGQRLSLQCGKCYNKVKEWLNK